MDENNTAHNQLNLGLGQSSPCPSCGYCPTCGRARSYNWQPAYQAAWWNITTPNMQGPFQAGSISNV